MPSLDLGPVVGPQGEQGATGAQGIRGEQGLPGPNQVTNSTATPLTGVLTGNGSVVGVANIDAEPTEDSTGFAQSGGTNKAIKGRVPVYGKGKNLLRNWYFAGGGTGRGVFPVNQRGATSGTTVNIAYFVDGWKWTYGSSPGSWSLVSDGMSVSPSSSSDSAVLFQELGTLDSLLNGEKITASVLYSDGQFYSGSITRNSGTSQTFVSIGGIWVLNMVDRSMRLRFTTARTVVAVKLELGSEQTLCHNEGTAESPVWVLNDVPDYEYELYRCMTSTADSSDTYANKTLATGQEIAYVENGTTATRNYTAGQYISWNGLTYTADTAIAIGATFYTSGGNKNLTECVGGGLNEVNNKKSIISTSVIFETSGRTAVFRSKGNTATSTDIRNALIPQVYRPSSDILVPFAYYNGSTWVNDGRCIRINYSTGAVTIYNLAGGMDASISFSFSAFCATWVF